MKIDKKFDAVLESRKWKEKSAERLINISNPDEIHKKITENFNKLNLTIQNEK